MRGISGPSFLGLNDPAPAPRRRGSLSIDPLSIDPRSIDPQSASGSSNLDYLLEDDEPEPRRGGAGKLVLIVVALALAVGLGYLRWKDQGFGWLGSQGGGKPAAAQNAAQNSDATDAGSGATPAAIGAGSPATSTPEASDASSPAAAPASSPTIGSPTAVPGNSAASGTAPATVTPANVAPASSVPAITEATPAGAATNVPVGSSPAAPAKDPNSYPNSAAKASPVAASPQPDPSASAPPAKPHAAVRPAPPFDAVSEAQKYLYGKSVAQNCDHGMRLLKPAADQGNAKAMIEMGALYSAGLCTPHDLPTAYRWFALALRKDPDNQDVQADLQKLWGEMTQPERQLAIRLSQ